MTYGWGLGAYLVILRLSHFVIACGSLHICKSGGAETNEISQIIIKFCWLTESGVSLNSILSKLFRVSPAS